MGLIFQTSHTYHRVDGVINLRWPWNREMTRLSPTLHLLVFFLSSSYSFTRPLALLSVSLFLSSRPALPLLPESHLGSQLHSLPFTMGCPLKGQSAKAVTGRHDWPAEPSGQPPLQTSWPLLSWCIRLPSPSLDVESWSKSRN